MQHKIYKTIFQVRRATYSEWITVNPILRLAEPAFETDTYKLKIGDGHTPYDLLPYIGSGSTPGGSSIEYVVNAQTHFDFPSIGQSNVIYKAEAEKSLYQWDSKGLKYVLLGNPGDYSDVELIDGGNANGTN